MRRLLLVSVMFAVGCATTSPTLEPAGQTLDVKTSTSTVKDGFWSDDTWVPPGTEFHNFDGFYADTTRVDELTFFHVAGDKEREAAVLEWREKNNTAIAASWGLSGLGVAVAATGATMFAVLGADDPEAFPSTQLGQASIGLAIAGGVIVGFAAFGADAFFGPSKRLHYAGNGRDVDEMLLFPLDEAAASAATHNAANAGAPATTDTATDTTDTATGAQP